MTGLLAHRTGEIWTTTFVCSCGAVFIARRRVVGDVRNRALNTSVDLDFGAARAFRLEHRPHMLVHDAAENML
ncbi:hypothetical protein [Prescottella subtropica]|uniref:hypothetical protein n=1 Tax=Prescottella subtropica TaxID=2545757 RepID=UPI0010F9905F|nr:hypothetical protein [Prescottella subtropica]